MFTDIDSSDIQLYSVNQTLDHSGRRHLREKNLFDIK